MKALDQLGVHSLARCALDEFKRDLFLGTAMRRQASLNAIQKSHIHLIGGVVELFRVAIHQKADAHEALRKILSGYVGEAPEKICFEVAPSGKPLHPKIFFSLSHSRNLALIAVSEAGPVGVDIEWVRPVQSKLLIAKRFFAPSEHAYLENLPSAAQQEAFFKLWTAKEALTKAKGARLVDELSNEVPWDQVVPVLGLEGYIGHLAGDKSNQETSP